MSGFSPTGRLVTSGFSRTVGIARITTAVVALLVVTIAVSLTASAQITRTQPAPAARLSDGTLQQLQTTATTRDAGTFIGISRFAKGSLILHVNSNRALIARAYSLAREDGGRYTPLAEMRSDVVHVACGDSELGDVLECERVTMATLDGKAIAPVSYSAKPESFRNAVGVRWTVRTVFATYRTIDLLNGFIVTGRTFDGTEWPLEVTRDAAERELLLAVGD